MTIVMKGRKMILKTNIRLGKRLHGFGGFCVVWNIKAQQENLNSIIRLNALAESPADSGYVTGHLSPEYDQFPWSD